MGSNAPQRGFDLLERRMKTFCQSINTEPFCYLRLTFLIEGAAVRPNRDD
jgi:hypothetical protein